MTVNLRNSSPCPCSICLAPIARSKGVFKTTGNSFCFYRELQIHIFSIIHTLKDQTETSKYLIDSFINLGLLKKDIESQTTF